MARSASFTRPADTTAYASGDLVANNVTAGSVVPMSLTPPQRTGNVKRVTIKKSGTSVTNASFRLHLYDSSPTPVNGDNGAWSTTVAAYLGSVDVTVDKAFTDGAVGVGTCDFNLAGTSLFALLEARGAYTPASAEVFTVTLA
jgi:hypothetical protein